MNALKSLTRCHQISRNISSTSVRMRDMAKFKELQRQMQVDDGVPVYLKKGGSDKLIFGTVVLGLITVLGMAAQTVKMLIYPPPNK